MKKYRCIFACIAASLALLSGCGHENSPTAETGPATATTISSESVDKTESADITAWKPTLHDTVNNLDGVTMTVKEGSSSPTGLTAVFKNESDRQCIYGEPFWLEKKTAGKWYTVPVSFTGNYAFNSIGYDLSPGADREWTVDWAWLYGHLDAGEYRIMKNILDYRSPGDYTDYYLAAEFEVYNAASEESDAASGESDADSEESDAAVKVVEHGNVTFLSGEVGPEVKLPLFGIAATYGVSYGSTAPAVVPSSPVPEIAFAIPEDQQDQLAAFWVNQGGDGNHGILLLGPRSWHPVEAGVGADGSIGIVLENPDDPAEKLTYNDTSGGCQGCAIANIATYFPSLRKWAEDQAFPGTEMKFKQQSLLSPRIMSYSREHADPGYEINGVAYQQHGEGDAWFRLEEMSSAASRHRLAETVLKFFVEQYDVPGS